MVYDVTVTLESLTDVFCNPIWQNILGALCVALGTLFQDSPLGYVSVIQYPCCSHLR